ncbi:hypothetical protein [Belnapia sp. F-4-1]|uniref:hypothetical protein n=1 Tax=Belnapia sp. F-4-1 TaxID=1545443 RepID=UPI0005BCB689|nr:hypothetical protein [Belnapia sp. F-4-1]
MIRAEKAAQAADALIAALAKAERDYPLQRHPGEPWSRFLARTLPAPAQAALRRLDGPPPPRKRN